MDKVFYIFLGFLLGIASNFLWHVIINILKKRKIAKTLISEIDEINRRIQYDLSLLKNREDLPSLLSPICYLSYRIEYFSEFKNEIYLFDSVLISELFKYYDFIRIVEFHKDNLRGIVKGELPSNILVNSELIKVLVDTLTHLLKYSEKIKRHLKNELNIKKYLLKKVKNLFGEPKMKKGIAYTLIILSLFVGIIIGFVSNKALFEGKKEKFEFIQQRGRNSYLMKINKNTGEAWILRKYIWHKIDIET